MVQNFGIYEVFETPLGDPLSNSFYLTGPRPGFSQGLEGSGVGLHMKEV